LPNRAKNSWLQLACDLCLEPRRQLASVTSTQLIQPQRPIASHWLVVVNAVDRTQALNAVHVLDTFSDQPTPLTMQPAVIFFGTRTTLHTFGSPRKSGFHQGVETEMVSPRARRACIGSLAERGPSIHDLSDHAAYARRATSYHQPCRT
jgi:hypothetical protein